MPQSEPLPEQDDGLTRERRLAMTDEEYAAYRKDWDVGRHHHLPEETRQALDEIADDLNRRRYASDRDDLVVIDTTKRVSMTVERPQGGHAVTSPGPHPRDAQGWPGEPVP